jgi:hypothetical protein
VTRPAPGDPFRALGLAPDAGLTGDDVRAAWRRVAAATHPDRADGGDPAAFAAAAAAYTVLRTAAGRGEALADLLGVPAARAGTGRTLGRPTLDRRTLGRPRLGRPRLGRPRLGRPRLGRRAAAAAVLADRARRGRPLVLALRAVVATGVSAAAVLATGWQPASLAIVAGMLTWLICTGRADLAAPP